MDKADSIHVVVVGGGFAGLRAVRNLALRGPRGLRITLIDRRNHHLFQPLLYQVAMAGLSPADIAVPIRTIVRRYRNVEVMLAEVTSVDRPNRTVHTNMGPVPYDALVLACGATHSYFGHEEWEEHAPGLKTVEQATEIRRRVLTAFERAELECDPQKRKELLTFVVVGGGPTGVELAGALGEISRFTLGRDFRRIDPTRTTVLLIEAGPRVLPSFSEELSRGARRDLERLGVSVRTERLVTAIDDSGVELGEGEDRERIRAATVLWAAGVRASTPGPGFGAETDRSGRVMVEKDLSLADTPEVFVVGDQAHVEQADGSLVPGMAPAAIQMGECAANNILRDLRGAPRVEFRYRDKGQMATIGRARAVAESGGWKMRGVLAWLAWCFVHIFYLIGFRNRLLVAIQWAWSYARFRRGARLITDPDWRQERQAKDPTVERH